MNAVIQATYVGLKFIGSRSVAQVVLEFPIEQADDFVAKFGTPQPGIAVACAIARLEAVAEPPTEPAREPEPPPSPAEPPTSIRRANGPLRPSARAALLCQDSTFQAWVSRQPGAHPDAIEEAAAQYVRARCQVLSRAELDTDLEATRRWITLLTAFEADTGRMAEAR